MDDANADLTAILAVLLETAAATKLQETDVRREAAARIAGLEKARVRAYRRHHLIHLLGSAAAIAPDRDAALAAEVAALADRLEWGEVMTAEQREVVAKLHPVMTRVAEAAGVPAGPDVTPVAQAVADPSGSGPADLVAALATFEAWFATRFESDFFHAFERYTPESRATDF